ncbi:MAG TPA: translation initiation factor IF-3, partial [Bacillota bacterium]|nr:translation initiation factor IF-3 [Bacillota bacterium]
RKKQHIVSIKEVRMTPKIEDHDFEVKVKNAEKFLREGDKVKVSVRFRGREIVHTDIAQRLLREMAATLSAVSSMEREPKVEGRNMIMILSPKQD